MICGKHIILPILVGTDNEAAYSWSGNKCIHYIPLPCIDSSDVIEHIRQSNSFPVISKLRSFAYELTKPKLIATFLKAITKLLSDDVPNRNELIKKAWLSTQKRCLIPHVNNDVLLTIVSHAITGIEVKPTDSCCPNITPGFTWQHARQQRLCTFIPHDKDSTRVCISVPYYLISHFRFDFMPYNRGDSIFYVIHAIACCLRKLKRINELLGDNFETNYDAWISFRATYEALIINGFLYLGRDTIPLKELYNGCVVNGCDMIVKLLPMIIVDDTDTLSSVDIDDMCNNRGGTSTVFGFMIVNRGQRNMGNFEYIYALTCISQSNHRFVVIKNQHVKVSSKSNLLSLHEYKNIKDSYPYIHQYAIPCVEVIGIHAIGCNDGDDCIQPIDLPPNVYYYSKPQCNKQYYKDLCFYPAVTPYVNLNYANNRSIVFALQGTNQHDMGLAAKVIIKYRERERRVCSIDEFREVLKAEGIVNVTFSEWVDC